MTKSDAHGDNVTPVAAPGQSPSGARDPEYDLKSLPLAEIQKKAGVATRRARPGHEHEPFRSVQRASEPDPLGRSSGRAQFPPLIPGLRLGCRERVWVVHAGTRWIGLVRVWERRLRHAGLLP